MGTSTPTTKKTQHPHNRRHRRHHHQHPILQTEKTPSFDDLYTSAIESYNPSLLDELEQTGYLERHHLPRCLSNTRTSFFAATLLRRKTSGIGSPLSILSSKDVKRLSTLVMQHPIPPERLDLHTERILFVSVKASSLDVPGVDDCLSDLVGMGLWEYVSERRRELEMRKFPNLKELWDEYKTKRATTDGAKYFVESMDLFLDVLKGPIVQSLSREEEEKTGMEEENEEPDIYRDIIEEESGSEEEEESDEGESEEEEEEESKTTEPTLQTTLTFLHSYLQLLITLLSQIPTRPHLHTLLLDKSFTTYCGLSPLSYRKHGSNLFLKLLNEVMTYENFPIHDHDPTKPFLPSQEEKRLYNRIFVLQKMCFKHHKEKLIDMCFAGVTNAATEGYLISKLGKLTRNELEDLSYRLRLIPAKSESHSRSFLLSLLVYRHAARPSESQLLASLPLYPDETLLWDETLVPPGTILPSSTTILALPQLNLQFLSFQDYLLRLYQLYRLESAYGIRGDIVQIVKRLHPALQYDISSEDAAPRTAFKGWARMSIEIRSFEVQHVAKPKLGERVPATVEAVICIDLEKLGRSVKREWDGLREFDNLFLVSIDASRMDSSVKIPLVKGRPIREEEDVTFSKRMGIAMVRGCMLTELRDEGGVVLNEPFEEVREPKGSKRFLRVQLDPSQYARDVKFRGGDSAVAETYRNFNVLIRRHARENNFKSTLETARELLKSSSQAIYNTVPIWLQPVLLGFGDPTRAHYSSDTMKRYASQTAGVSHPESTLDYGDSFLDDRHLKDSFPDKDVIISEPPPSSAHKATRHNYKIKIVSDTVHATPYPFFASGKGNPIRFTPTQISAIRSGLCPGLTLLIGPPGTGKTDVAVQIVSNLYHSFPTQKTLLITHSNAALNDLFQKVMSRGDIDERYLLRLGAGERELRIESQYDFTKGGRVKHSLERRKILLNEVQALSESLGVSTRAERGSKGESSYTCETAGYFDLHHVQKRIQIFESATIEKGDDDDVASYFPFARYFHLDSPSRESLPLHHAKSKFRSLNAMFDELSSYRPLELLRTQRKRTDYLLTKQARIVAMTCTHAAIARSHLLELDFQYDNIVLEEAGQMLEIETFIPLLLQKPSSEDKSSSRLKRICLIGDHNQLPPVVRNLAIGKIGKLNQSMFARLIRLGVPTILLDRQGRARTEIAKLYSWRYADLGDLEHVETSAEFRVANPGFVHTYQMINVENFENKGETTPTAYFYQNVGEAEYVIALFQFMVLVGYPPDAISILTTYNGQKELLHDILSQRCGPNTPLAEIRPGAISTVDQYQGQQNDYVLLSLVRTKSIGYLRDVRRLVVAVSRARLGLYVVGRTEVFERCHALNETMTLFRQNGNLLKLVKGEQFPTERGVKSDVEEQNVYVVKDVGDLGSLVYEMQKEYVKKKQEEELNG